MLTGIHASVLCTSCMQTHYGRCAFCTCGLNGIGARACSTPLITVALCMYFDVDDPCFTCLDGLSCSSIPFLALTLSWLFFAAFFAYRILLVLFSV